MKFVFAAIGLLLSGLSIGQSSKIDRLIPTRQNQKVIRHYEGRATSETTFIGSFVHEGQTFYIFKEFLKIQAAVILHGNSFVYITDGKDILKTFQFSMPDELPRGLSHGHILFDHERLSLLKNNKLTDAICTDQFGCIFSNEFTISQDTP